MKRQGIRDWAAGLALVGLATSTAGAASRPTVVELFTSQGCSSCPPAEAVLLDLDAKRPDILALAFHIDYWDRLGWKDPFSSRAATDRQRAYQSLIGSEQIYTPQAVVDGRLDVVGSDGPAVSTALNRARDAAAPPVAVTVTRAGDTLSVQVGEGAGRARVLVVGYDPRHATAVARGENAGRSIQQANVVRSLTRVGEWAGQAAAFTIPAPAGERMAVLLQAPTGEFLGVAR